MRFRLSHLQVRIQIALNSLRWKCRCKVCGATKSCWRMLPYWQPLNLPGVVGHRGGAICKPCHSKLCGKRHGRHAMCAKDLGAAVLPTWTWPQVDIDAVLDEELGA